MTDAAFRLAETLDQDWGVDDVLVIPDSDLTFWRGRQDVIRTPGFFAVRYGIVADPRYAALISAARELHVPEEYALLVLLLVAGHAVRAEIPGVLAHRGRKIEMEHVFAYWHLPTGDLVRKAISAVIVSGWLNSIPIKDLPKDSDTSSYVCDRARTRTIARVRARSHASVDRQDRQDRQDKDRQDRRLSRPDAARRSRPNTAVTWCVDSGWGGITEQDRADWAAAYPAVDVEQELARATVWLRANPTKAGKRNYRRFLANWFSRTQDRGGTVCAAPRGSQTASRGVVEDDWHADIGHVRPEVFEDP